MNTVLKLATSALVLSGAPYQMNAAVLAYEGFAEDLYSTGGINVQGPVVSGFDSALWSGNGSLTNINLTYTSDQAELETGGYSYIRNNGAALRGLDVSPAGPFASYLNSAQTDIGGDNQGTLFGSFLMASPNSSFSGFIELNNDGVRSFRLGINNGVWSRRIAGGGWATLAGAPSVEAGVTNLVVYSITFDRGDGRAAVDVWINPTIGAGTPAPTSSFDVGDLIAFDDVEMGLYFSDDAIFDEIRFGESFADVTPTPGNGGGDFGVFSEYDIVDGFADTGDFMGWVYVDTYPWVFVVDLGRYVYSGGGIWFNVPR